MLRLTKGRNSARPIFIPSCRYISFRLSDLPPASPPEATGRPYDHVSASKNISSSSGEKKMPRI